MSKSINELTQQCVEDSKRWFGDTGVGGLPYFTIALTGEVGEFANILKKIWRGTLDIEDKQVQFELDMELTDVFIYVLNLAAELNVDLELAYEHKRAINEERFMLARQKREAANNE